MSDSVTPWIAACEASLSITNSWSSLKLTSMKSMMSSSHLILFRPLLLLPPIPPSIRVFSNESTLHMRWPKYWSFSFSIILSKEIPGLISFRMDWLPKPLTVWITKNCGKFWKRWEYQTTWSASWEICIQVRKQQLELDIEQQTGSKSEKEYVKAVHCHPASLTCMQSTSLEMLGWMKPKLESGLPGEISITSDMQMIPPYVRKWRITKRPLDKSERGEWKSWPKTQHLNN